MTNRLLDLGLGQTNLSQESFKTDSVLFEFLNTILIQTRLASTARVFFWANCSATTMDLTMWDPGLSFLPWIPVPLPLRFWCQGCKGGRLCIWVLRSCGHLWQGHGSCHMPPWSGMMTENSHCCHHLSVTLTQTTRITNPVHS